MKPLTQSKNITILPVLIALTLVCFALSPTARAVPRHRTSALPISTQGQGVTRFTISPPALEMQRWVGTRSPRIATLVLALVLVPGPFPPTTENPIPPLALQHCCSTVRAQKTRPLELTRSLLTTAAITTMLSVHLRCFITSPEISTMPMAIMRLPPSSAQGHSSPARVIMPLEIQLWTLSWTAMVTRRSVILPEMVWSRGKETPTLGRASSWVTRTIRFESATLTALNALSPVSSARVLSVPP